MDFRHFTSGRNYHLLYHINLKAPGIEIGPGASPIIPKGLGIDVKTIDIKSKVELTEIFESRGIDGSKIEEVDFIWRGEPLPQLTGRWNDCEWILASHVIEHVPDLIGFLQNCEALLSRNGMLSLAIPDKRYCFDYFRPVSGLGAVIDSHLQKRSEPSSGTMTEFLLNYVARNHKTAWNIEEKGEFQAMYTVEQIRSGFCEKDVHVWCFVPHTFRLLIHDLNSLGWINLKEKYFALTEGHEFFMTLSPQGHGLPMSREEALEQVMNEI